MLTNGNHGSKSFQRKNSTNMFLNYEGFNIKNTPTLKSNNETTTHIQSIKELSNCNSSLH